MSRSKRVFRGCLFFFSSGDGRTDGRLRLRVEVAVEEADCGFKVQGSDLSALASLPQCAVLVWTVDVGTPPPDGELKLPAKEGLDPSTCGCENTNGPPFCLEFELTEV